MERNFDHWSARLPATFKEHVVRPVRVESHHDDGVPASKWRGYDALGIPCYYRHSFSQWDAAFDDEDRSLTQLLREEHFEVWRSLGGPWVRRVPRIEGGGRKDGVVQDSGFEVVEPQAIPWL